MICHWMTMRARIVPCATLLLSAALAVAAQASAIARPWPLRDPFLVMNTISTLQDYYGKPGFHHGLDLQAPAGTAVYAPVSGKVSLGFYYPRYQSPYTYRVVIEDADGMRWEFHHVDPATVPSAVQSLAAEGATVAAGDLLARIYDASTVGLPPHVHVDVINGQGVYQDPLRFLPPLSDNEPPRIFGFYLVDEQNRAVAGHAAGHTVEPVEAGRRYDLVADVVDMIPPATWGDSLYGLDVELDGKLLSSVRFDQLPDKDYLKGAAEVYRTEPFTGFDGQTVANQIELSSPRHFLFHASFTAPITAPSSGMLRFDVRAIDFARNETQLSVVLRLEPQTP